MTAFVFCCKRKVQSVDKVKKSVIGVSPVITKVLQFRVSLFIMIICGLNPENY